MAQFRGFNKGCHGFFVISRCKRIPAGLENLVRGDFCLRFTKGCAAENTKAQAHDQYK